jgi:hypothetical protein
MTTDAISKEGRGDLSRPVRKIGFCNVHRQLNRDNFLFEHANTAIGDDLLKPFQELGLRAAERGVTAATVDVIPLEEMDSIVFIDMPRRGDPFFRRARAAGIPLYLMVLESPLVASENNDPANHRHFTKVFTYNDALVDGSFYIKLNYAFDFSALPDGMPVAERKLCATIAGNKRSRHPQELYTERIRAIRWFERHHPEDFDLYGFGWDDRSLRGMKLTRLLNPVKLAKKLLAPRFPSYRGTVERKRPVLARYKFALCYENIRDVPGYITEKIFDAFFAGSVPVYRGADNIADHIPPECFIDLRAFGSYGELYDTMANMGDSVYQEFRGNIARFLQSDRALAFSIDRFAATVLDTVLGRGDSAR